jgi:hypothetical protein
VNHALSSLIVGERLISRCEDGLLVAEYALFDSTEVLLSAGAGQGVREQGYLTTAGAARERLQAEGITPELANKAFHALRPGHLRALARGTSVLHAVERLGPYEAFEGGVYQAILGTYRGTWLDMAALARACPLRSAAVLLQAIHLSQVVEEIAEDAPVRLLTAHATANLRAGERTWVRVNLKAAKRLPAVLRAMRVASRPRYDTTDEVEVREELLRGLRARSTGSTSAHPRIRSLATLVARTGRTPPPTTQVPLESGPSLEAKIAEGVNAGTDPLALFEELRGHTQLLRGEDHLRAVAHFLSGMADRSPSRPELGILASRAWLAAGESRHARHFSKMVVDNPAAEDSVRLLALEIIESTETSESAVHSAEAPPIVPMPILMAVPHEQFAPVGASLPPFGSDRGYPPRPYATTIPRIPAIPSVPQIASVAHAPPPPASPAPRKEEPAAVVATPVVIVDMAHVVESPQPRADLVAEPDTERTPPPPPDPAPVRPRVRRSEIVESLALPEGLSEDMLAVGTRPATPEQARVGMTRLARTLGRDYRLWYGTTLVTNAVAIETMQRHLRRRFDDASSDQRMAQRLEIELTRHGALLSEILARSLGGTWVDVSGEQLGHWAMAIYPDIRVWPIGRVYRFFQQGHREADLVAYYLDLETATRGT